MGKGREDELVQALRARLIGCGLLLSTMLIIVPTDARAQSFTTTATFVVGDQAKLKIASSALTFPNANPDSVGRVPADRSLTVTASIRFKTGQAVLTAIATDDLRSGMNVIGISALKWTASGSGFMGGSMARTAVTVGTWASSGSYTGTLTFTLDNSWTYAVGDYGTTVTFTLAIQ